MTPTSPAAIGGGRRGEFDGADASDASNADLTANEKLFSFTSETITITRFDASSNGVQDSGIQDNGIQDSAQGLFDVLERLLGGSGSTPVTAGGEGGIGLPSADDVDAPDVDLGGEAEAGDDVGSGGADDVGETRSIDYGTEEIDDGATAKADDAGGKEADDAKDDGKRSKGGGGGGGGFFGFLSSALKIASFVVPGAQFLMVASIAIDTVQKMENGSMNWGELGMSIGLGMIPGGQAATYASSAMSFGKAAAAGDEMGMLGSVVPFVPGGAGQGIASVFDSAVAVDRALDGGDWGAALGAASSIPGQLGLDDDGRIAGAGERAASYLDAAGDAPIDFDYGRLAA